MTDYPAAIYSPRTKENKAGIVYDAAKTEIGFAEDVTKLDDEVVAIETELGANPKGGFGSVKLRLEALVPYTGADDDVDLGAHNLETTGIGIFGDGGIKVADSGFHLTLRALGAALDENEAIDLSVSGDPPHAILVSGEAKINQDTRIAASPAFAGITVAAISLIIAGGNVSINPPNYLLLGTTSVDRIDMGRTDSAIPVYIRSKGFTLTIKNGRVGINDITPACALQVNGAIASKTLTFALVGPTDDLDVSGVNTIFINAGANAVTIGGFVGGVDGQVLNIAIIDGTNAVKLEHAEGGGNQDILLHAGADETLLGEYGGWTLVCHAGVDWHDVSHAKHV